MTAGRAPTLSSRRPPTWDAGAKPAKIIATKMRFLFGFVVAFRVVLSSFAGR